MAAEFKILFYMKFEFV